MKPIIKGEYVLATKYSDGDPRDHWAVGFFDRTEGDRHFIVGNDGQQLRANGFRRIGHITPEKGAWLLKNSRDIEMFGRSVWGFARRSCRTFPISHARERGTDPLNNMKNTEALIKDWRKQASGCMGMARHHEKERWKAHHSRKDAESHEHENDRYRWRRVAETFRHCAKELRRMVAANKQQPQPNHRIGHTENADRPSH